MSEYTGIHYGNIRTILEKTGKVIDNNNPWIAVHARAMGATLITNKTNKFSRVDDLILGKWV